MTQLSEETKTRLFPGIAFRGEPRRAWVIGTGLDVWELVDLLRSYNANVAERHEAHPRISEHHIRLAARYAERFPEETDPFLDQQRRGLDELHALHPFLELGE